MNDVHIQKLYKLHVVLTVIATMLLLIRIVLPQFIGCNDTGLCTVYTPSALEQFFEYLVTIAAFTFMPVSVIALVFGVAVVRSDTYTHKVAAWLSFACAMVLAFLAISMVVAQLETAVYT